MYYYVGMGICSLLLLRRRRIFELFLAHVLDDARRTGHRHKISNAIESDDCDDSPRLIRLYYLHAHAMRYATESNPLHSFLEAWKRRAAATTSCHHDNDHDAIVIKWMPTATTPFAASVTATSDDWGVLCIFA